MLKCLTNNTGAMCTIYWIFTCLIFQYQVSAQYLEIQAKPSVIDPTQDDLVIVCSATATEKIEKVYSITLKRNTSMTIGTQVVVDEGEVYWYDNHLKKRATAVGSTRPPSSAHLELTIPKGNIHCPGDFGGYWCHMYMRLNETNSTLGIDHENTDQISIQYKLQPTSIEKPQVRVLGEVSDTSRRKFTVGSVLQLTCSGQIGSEPNITIRWCYKTTDAVMFTAVPQTPVLSDAIPSGCQYNRSSTIIYNMTDSDIYTQFLCEYATSGLCDTGTARQYLKIAADIPLVRTTTLPAPSRQLVAFYARVSSSLSIHNRQVIIFDDVVTNIGNGYNGNDGIFTAPLDGAYVFVWHIRSSGAELNTELMINNAKYGSTHLRAMNHLDDSVSGNVVAHVNKGDRVFIRVYFPTSGGSGRGSLLSDDSGKPSFSGWIIQ